MQHRCDRYRRLGAASAQSGVTITMLVIYGFVLMGMVYLFLIVGPLLYERYKVNTIMTNLTASPTSGKATNQQFHANLVRQLDLQDVRRFNTMKAGDFLKVNLPRKKTDKKSVTFFYTASEPIYGEIYVTLKFEQTYIFGGGGAGGQ